MTDLGGKREDPTPYDLINYLSPRGYEPEEINNSDYYDISIWE